MPLEPLNPPETALPVVATTGNNRIVVYAIISFWRGGRCGCGFAHMIYSTSPLHDIGKIGIPDCVLLKPGRLSAGSSKS